MAVEEHATVLQNKRLHAGATTHTSTACTTRLELLCEQSVALGNGLPRLAHALLHVHLLHVAPDALLQLFVVLGERAQWFVPQSHIFTWWATRGTKGVPRVSLRRMAFFAGNASLRAFG